MKETELSNKCNTIIYLHLHVNNKPHEYKFKPPKQNVHLRSTALKKVYFSRNNWYFQILYERTNPDWPVGARVGGGQQNNHPLFALHQRGRDLEVRRRLSIVQGRSAHLVHLGETRAEVNVQPVLPLQVQVCLVALSMRSSC